MKTIIKKIILLSCLSATLAWGADDEDSIGKKRKYEEPEEEQVPQSGARPGGEARKFFRPSMEQSRQNYVNARDAFHAALPLSPESEINHGDVTQAAQTMIQDRLNLHRLLVANVEDSQIKAAYLAVLLIDLYNILTKALPSINTLVAGGMNEFLKDIFGEIDCPYNDNNLIEYLAKALQDSGDIDEDKIKNLLNFFRQYQRKDLQSLIAFLNQQFLLFHQDPVAFYNKSHSPFWMIIFIELNSQKTLFTLLQTLNDSDDTPLHDAFLNGRTDLIKALLDANIFTPENWLALVKTPNKSLSTPLHFAFVNGRTDLIKALLEANIFTPENWLALITMTDNYNRTPLHFAFAHGRTDLIKALLDANIFTPENWLALITMTDNYNRTPLHFAFWNGRTDLIKALLDANIFTPENWLNLIAMPDIYNRTPLHLAFRNGKAYIFKLLLEFCKKNPQFAGMLKQLLANIQRNKPLTPGEHLDNEKNQATQEALKALLAWPEAFNPNEGCNEEKHSFSKGGDDDDDPQGGGASSGNPQGSGNQSVITITMPGTLATDPMATRQTDRDSSSKKAAAFSLADFLKLENQEQRIGEGLRSMMVQILGS